MSLRGMNWERISIAAGIAMFLMAGVLGYMDYKQIRTKKKAAEILSAVKRKEQEIKKAVKGRVKESVLKNKEGEKSAEQQDPRKEALQMIENLRVSGKSLPACPLIFPLVDEKGRINALGSYLSCLAMNQASFLPQAVFCLPNPNQLFHDFRLFDSSLGQYHEQFSKQLPYLFGTRDYARGKLFRSKTGYKITLQFTGARQTRKFEKKFTNGQLHLAPAWMASCLHRWAGYKPAAAQAAYLKKKVFTNDKDLTRAASLESLFRQGGVLFVNQWDKILAKNPLCGYLVDGWIGVLDGREQTNHLDLIEKLAAKYPENSFYESVEAVELYALKKYDEALKIAFRELTKDNNNPDWYDIAAFALEGKGFYEEAVALLKNWTQSHPDNPNAWIRLAKHTHYWAWRGRGGDWSKSMSPEVSKVFRERVEEGLKAAQKAADLAPLYGRAWGELMAYGNAAGINQETMRGYFEKVLRLDPNDNEAFYSYMDYLNPKWNGSQQEMFAFAKKFKKRIPNLMTVPCVEAFQSFSRDLSAEGINPIGEKNGNQLAGSPYWDDFAKGCENNLKITPGDFNEWRSYIAWAVLAEKTKPVLDLAKKISKKEKELGALYPYVVLALSEAEQNRLGSDADSKGFMKDPKVVKERLGAYQMLLKLDPHNWDIWNRLAYLDVQNNKTKDARKALGKIGNHWVQEVWSKDEFVNAKKSLGVK